LSDAIDIEEAEHVPAVVQEPDLSLVVAVPAIPDRRALVDSKWMAALKGIVKQVKTLVVKDAASNQLAVNLQSRLTEAGKQLEKARKDMKEPFLAAGRAIDAAVVGPVGEIAAAVEVLRQGQVAFFQAEQKRIAKEEADRQAEIARLQKIADDEAARLKAEADKRAKEAKAEADRQAAEEKRLADEAEARRLAGIPVPLAMDVDEEPAPEPLPPEPPPVKSEAQVALEAAKHAPAPKAAVAVGVAMRTTLEIKSYDVDRMPAAYVIKEPDLEKVRREWCVGYKRGQPLPTLDGVVFEAKEMPVTRAPRI
jgi:hypothetical protein